MGRTRGKRAPLAVQPQECPYAKHTLHTRDVAVLTGWSTANVRMLSRQGKIPFMMRGNYRLYNKDEVLTALKRLQQTTQEGFDDLGV